MPQNMGKINFQTFLSIFLFFFSDLLFLSLKKHNWIIRIMNMGKLHSNAVYVVVTKDDSTLFRR